VSLLRHLIAEFISDLKSGTKWEQLPHTLFYGHNERFALITNKPAYPAAAGGVASGAAVGKTPKPNSPPNNNTKRQHHEGLCFWYLAGELGITDRAGAPYKCRDATFKHRALKNVPYHVVQNLVKDSSFMSDSIHTSIRERVLAELPKKKTLFK